MATQELIAVLRHRWECGWSECTDVDLWAADELERQEWLITSLSEKLATASAQLTRVAEREEVRK